MMHRIYILMVLGLIMTVPVFSQEPHADSLHFLESAVVGGDTLPNYDIREVKVFPRREFSSRREKRRYNRLMQNVKKAYPFSIIARNELRIMSDSLQYIHGAKKRKQFIKDYEKEMFLRYEAELRKLTFSQGRILIKLIYREIGNTSYNLVKEYRGDFSAFFWQGIARIFGTNLKSTYDPEEEDADIEHIILLIEAGIL